MLLALRPFQSKVQQVPCTLHIFATATNKPQATLGPEDLVNPKAPGRYYLWGLGPNVGIMYAVGAPG